MAFYFGSLWSASLFSSDVSWHWCRCYRIRPTYSLSRRKRFREESFWLWRRPTRRHSEMDHRRIRFDMILHFPNFSLTHTTLKRCKYFTITKSPKRSSKFELPLKWLAILRKEFYSSTKSFRFPSVCPRAERSAPKPFFKPPSKKSISTKIIETEKNVGGDRENSALSYPRKNVLSKVLLSPDLHGFLETLLASRKNSGNRLLLSEKEGGA